MHHVSHQIGALRLTTLLLIWASISVSARVISAPPVDPVEQLRHVESFAVGGIGVVGATSDGERALRNLLEDSAATAKLVGLLTKATPAGQLYALLGLRIHDRAAYDPAVKYFHAPDVSIETISGCIVSRLPFKQLLDSIKAGQYDDVLTRPAH